jgi:hypothetical protein
MFIKDLIMWCHYNVISENSNITKRPWQRLVISNNWNHLSAYLIWNILALNITGKVNKIVIKVLTSCLYGIIMMILYNIVMVFCVLSTYRHKCVTYCNILWYNVHLIYLQKTSLKISCRCKSVHVQSVVAWFLFQRY